jgi:hypothetical protein
MASGTPLAHRCLALRTYYYSQIFIASYKCATLIYGISNYNEPGLSKNFISFLLGSQLIGYLLLLTKVKNRIK